MANLREKLFNKEFLDKWHSNYQKLEALQKEHKSLSDNLDEALTQWISIQRRIRYMLPAELKDKLAALQFNFEEEGHSWEFKCRQLEEFVQQNGHCFLPDDQRYEVLKDWLVRQIISKRLLTESQYTRLDKLGVDWEMAISRDHRWEQLYERLKDFYSTFGHCRVPQRWPQDKQLALWVAVQRRLHMQGKLRGDREQKLRQLPFVWHVQQVYEEQWEQYFEQLQAFYNQHGHCRVPCRQAKLVSWIERQRLLYKNKILAPDRQQQLEQLNFIWSCDHIKTSNWNKRYRQLQAYYQLHGHSFVPVNCRENKALGTWVATQRWLEAKGKLDAAKKQQLDELGFVWTTATHKELQHRYEAQWNERFEQLKKYKQEHGTCQVSLKINPKLQRWTRWQRKSFYEGRLSKRRIDRLNALGFPWSVQEGYWLQMYEALAGFKSRYNHTRVPFRWAPNPQLAGWVYRMRRDQEKLDPQKVELLSRLDFDWALKRKKVVAWEEMYARLVAYKQAQGHTRVPVKWPEDPKLGKWVSRMRQQRAQLAAERVALLEKISFEWKGRIGRKPQPQANNQSHLYI